MEIGIVGLGFMGGSLAKTLKEVPTVEKISACDSNTQNLIDAFNDGTVDAVSSKIDNILANSDIVFICTPVDQIFEVARKLKDIVKPSCVVTDIGSVKNEVTHQIDMLGLKYVGSHPMKGGEKEGYINSKADLFKGAKWIITPTLSTDEKAVKDLAELLIQLETTPYYLSPQRHDEVVASISHVPHVIASIESLFASALDDEGVLEDLVAGGFKDSTRIAKVNMPVWQSIYNQNKDNIIEQLYLFRDMLDMFTKALEEGDQALIADIMKEGKEYREKLDNPDLKETSSVKKIEYPNK